MPTSIALEDIICAECYLLFQERILSNVTEFHEDMSLANGCLDICFGRRISIASQRTHKVQLDCLQQSTILRWTSADLAAFLERVGIACWLAAIRESRRLVVHDPNRPDNVMENSSPTVEDIVNCKPPPMPAPGIPQTPPMPAPIHQSPHSQQVLRLQTVPKVNSQNKRT